jgi:YbgC/YbaW family acyl-CoA thioester hydrolase
MESPRSIFETRLSVRPDDIDMHQHVHNSRYLDYVLAARLDQMDRCYQMSMEAFFERRLTWFVKTAHVDHHRALKMGDGILVRTSVSEIGKREVTVNWEILRERDEKLSADGYCRYTLVNRTSGRPQTIPEDVIKVYSV